MTPPANSSPPPCPPVSPLRDEHGFTMIELLVAMSMGTIVCLAAFLLLKFTTGDVSRITERVHVDQTGSVALEKIMLELHSACVVRGVTPIQTKSTPSVLKFISEGGTKSAFGTVRLHEIEYVPPKGESEGKLIEYTSKSIPPSSGGEEAPNYTFPKTPETKTLLLTGVKQAENKSNESIAVFQYYRYYHKSDTTPEYGRIDQAAITVPPEGLPEAEAEDVTKVTITFSLAPPGKELATFNHDRPISLEDSAVFRLATSSESPSNPNLPCTPET
ncbi:MAG: prepilin-type N-terminal cleavage/methylation domain-containing protein [Solirubrobacteraceae bacterium]